MVSRTKHKPPAMVVSRSSEKEAGPREIFHTVADLLALDQVHLNQPTQLLMLQDKLSLTHVREARALSRQFDVIVVGSEARGWEVALGFGSGSKRKRPFIVFHGQRWWSKRSKLLAFLAKTLTNVHLICLSESVRQVAIRAYGFAPDRVHNASWGVDTSYFQPRPEAGEYVLSAGTASRDYQTLVKAVEGAPFRLRIAADSAWFRESLNIDAARVPENVTVFSAGTYDALRDEYARARCVVVPLKDVEFACGYAVIAEAMAMGRPVICTATKCPSDLIEHGVNGLYVEPGNPTQLRQAIDRIYRDRGAAEAMGQAARKTAERDGSLEAYAERVRHILIRQ